MEDDLLVDLAASDCSAVLLLRYEINGAGFMGSPRQETIRLLDEILEWVGKLSTPASYLALFMHEYWVLKGLHV